jgi:hypothetical protein
MLPLWQVPSNRSATRIAHRNRFPVRLHDQLTGGDAALEMFGDATSSPTLPPSRPDPAPASPRCRACTDVHARKVTRGVTFSLLWWMP